MLDLKVTVDELEKERDFYFGKLRDIELICQENENNPVLSKSKVMDILYATEVNTGQNVYLHSAITAQTRNLGGGLVSGFHKIS